MGAEERRERFLCAPGLRIEAHEKLAEVQFRQMAEAIDRLEVLIDRLDKRIWLAIYGVSAAIMADVGQRVFHLMQ
jgi:hypothetical protein